MSRVRVHKRKYPGLPHLTSELEVLGTDEFGTWLYRAPDDALRRFGVQLMPVDHWWVAWWWIGWQDDPAHRWIAADMCTPPIHDSDGWRYDDLEIDVVGGPARFPSDSVMVVDEDEFEHSRRTVPYPEDVAVAALRSRDEVCGLIEGHAEPFHTVGWRHLDQRRRQNTR